MTDQETIEELLALVERGIFPGLGKLRDEVVSRTKHHLAAKHRARVVDLVDAHRFEEAVAERRIARELDNSADVC